MKGSNSLTSHTGERRTSRADKMSGMGAAFRKTLIGKSKSFDKQFSSRKRRLFLKNRNNDDKI